VLYLTAKGSIERERVDTVAVEALKINDHVTVVENAGSAWKMTDQIKTFMQDILLYLS